MATADRERRERIGRLFDDVVDLSTVERDAYYAAAAPSDRDVVAEVEELVRASREAPSFLDRPAAATELEGERAGPWKIEALIASGGMSDVYRAARDDEHLEWRAAVKVLKPGLDGDLFTARFRAEQRVLATLRHPHIVSLLDAGKIADGRLYLVMELIDGRPIDRYVKEKGLGLRERLEIFLDIALAVQYAHERLVVHCDLKPSNILVTHDGTPKLLDFGIARLLAPSGCIGESGPFTLAYASPEQLRGDVVSAATDVFSLGVILCELAVGARPWERRGLTSTEVLAEEMRRSVRIPDPDLDAVVEKALAVDRRERYSSVERLADDVRRFLNRRPVAARPVSVATRAVMFARRNPRFVAATALVVASLLFGVFGIWKGLVAAREEARTGWRAHSQAVETARFLEEMIAEMQRSPSPESASSRDTDNLADRESLLDRAAAKIDRSFGAYPETEGRLRLAIADLYLAIDRPKKAEPHIRRAATLIQNHRGFGKADRLRADTLMNRFRTTTSPPTHR